MVAEYNILKPKVRVQMVVDFEFYDTTELEALKEAEQQWYQMLAGEFVPSVKFKVVN